MEAKLLYLVNNERLVTITDTFNGEIGGFIKFGLVPANLFV